MRVTHQVVSDGPFPRIVQQEFQVKNGGARFGLERLSRLTWTSCQCGIVERSRMLPTHRANLR
jgi:hypothetical protein